MTEQAAEVRERWIPRPGVGSGRRLSLIAAALVVAHVALAWVLRAPSMGWGEDNAQYALLAREIAHGSYRQQWLTDAPIEARYPPGFPALLAFVNVVVGEHRQVQVAAVAICSGLSLLLLFAAARRALGDTAALWATSLAALNPTLLLESGDVFSEAPFRLLVVLTVWAAARPAPHRRHLFLAGLFAVLAALSRSAGVAVVAALALEWILARRWRALFALGVGSLPLAAWLAWTALAPAVPGEGVYLHDVARTLDVAAPSRATGFALRLGGNAWSYATTAVPPALAFPVLRGNPLDNVVWAILALTLFVTGARPLWRRWRMPCALLVVYGGMLLVWPWVEPRFVSPLVPFLFAGCAGALMSLGSRFGERGISTLMVSGGVIFGVGLLQVLIPTVRKSLACDRAQVAQSAACYPEDYRGYLQLAAFAKEHLPRPTVFFAQKPGALFYHSGHRSIRPAPLLSMPPDSLGRHLRASHVSHAVLTPIGGRFRRHNALVAQACREFELLRTFPGDTYLLQVRPGGPVDRDDATCRALAAWRDGVPPRWRDR